MSPILLGFHPANLTESLKYETAKILTENGEHEYASHILNKLCKKHPQSPVGKHVTYMSRLALVVCYQNTGNREDATNALAELLPDKIAREFPADSENVLHYYHKFRATLFRRLDRLDAAQQSFDQAENLFETHNLCFSRGFYHYILGNFDQAIQLYERCEDLLGNSANQFYLVYLYRALATMAASHEALGNIRLKLTPASKSDLEKYRSAAENYGNFKSDLNAFLVRTIDGLNSGHTISKSNLSQDIERLSRNLEAVEILRRDLIVILNYFQSTDLVSETEETLKILEARFQRRELELSARSEATETNGISVCLDIRSSAKTLSDDPKRFIRQVDYLRDQITHFLAESFDEVRNTGDGFLLTRLLSASASPDRTIADHTETLCAILKNIRVLHEDIAATRSFNVGIGVAYGSITTARVSHDDSPQRIASGLAQMLATRMCDLARPRGIVCYFGALDSDTIQRGGDYTFRKIPHRASQSTSKELQLLISEEVNLLVLKHRHAFRYVSAPFDPDNEARLFIDYGRNCEYSCIYCFSRGKSLNRGSDETAVIDELNKLGELEHPYLLSLGCYNDPLLGGNNEYTLRIIKKLAEWRSTQQQKHVIQFATKAPTTEVLELANAAEEEFGKHRIDGLGLAIMVSLASWTHLETIDKGRHISDINKEKLWDARNCYDHVAIIPYVKPFLPGITDDDAELEEFLSKFEVVVVGYPYWSRRLMNEMAQWCIDNNQKNLIARYNYFERHREPLPLIHPHLSSESLVAVNDSELLKTFCQNLNRDGSTAVFYTSPCAVSYLASTSCYTRIVRHEAKGIGREESAIRNGLWKNLCNGGKVPELPGRCPNTACIWHKDYVEN